MDDRGDFMGAIIGITGTGTPTDPYLITNLDNLAKVAGYADNLPDNYLRLTADIDYDATRTVYNEHLPFDGESLRRRFYFDMYGHSISNITIDGDVPLFSIAYARVYVQNGQLTNVRCVYPNDTTVGALGNREYAVRDNWLEFDNVSFQIDGSVAQAPIFNGCVFNRCAVNIRKRQSLTRPLIIASPSRPKNHVGNVFYQCDIKFDVANAAGHPLIDAMELTSSTHDLRMINCRFSGNVTNSVAMSGATDAIVAHMMSSDRCIYDIDVRHNRAENLYYSNFNDYTVQNLANYDMTKYCTGRGLTLVDTITLTDYDRLHAVYPYVRGV